MAGEQLPERPAGILDAAIGMHDEPGLPVAAAAHPFFAQLHMDARTAVTAAALLVDALDLDAQPVILAPAHTLRGRRAL